MKEIIIIGLVALLVLFTVKAFQSHNNAVDVRPSSSSQGSTPTEPLPSPPVPRIIFEDKDPVTIRHEAAEQYYAVITEVVIEEEVSQ
jgi:hypothetical protein